MDFNLLPLQHWSQLCHGTQSVCYSAWSSRIWIETANSHLPPALQQSWGNTVISTHLMFLKMQFIKAIAYWLAGRVSATACPSCQTPPGLSQTGTISTLVQLHKLAPDHFTCKSRGIIYHGHTLCRDLDFPIWFFCCGAINNRLFTLWAFPYKTFIQDKNPEMDNCQMHKPLCAIKSLSAAAFHPAHTSNTLSGKLPASLLWQGSWPCAAEGRHWDSCEGTTLSPLTTSTGWASTSLAKEQPFVLEVLFEASNIQVHLQVQ